MSTLRWIPLFARSPRRDRRTGPRRPSFRAAVMGLEDRCMLTLVTPVPLGPLPTTQVKHDGMIRPSSDHFGIGGDLYSFSVSQDQTVQITLQYPEQSSITSGYDSFVIALYEAKIPINSSQVYLARLLSDPLLGNNIHPPRPAATVGNHAPYLEYDFSGLGLQVGANDSVDGKFYILVQASSSAAEQQLGPFTASGMIDSNTPNDRHNAAYTLLVQAVNPAPVNHAPVAKDDAATTPAGQAVAIDVLGNDTDADGDALTITALNAAPGGTANVSAQGGHLALTTAGSPAHPAVTYTPRAGFSGTDTFAYSISDGKGGQASARVTVTVAAAVPSLPVVNFAQTSQHFVVKPGRAGSTITVPIIITLSHPSTVPVTVNIALSLAALAQPGVVISGVPSEETFPIGTTQQGFNLTARFNFGITMNQKFELDRRLAITKAVNADVGQAMLDDLLFSTATFGRVHMQQLLQALVSLQKSTGKLLKSDKLTSAGLQNVEAIVVGLANEVFNLNAVFGADKGKSGDSLFEAYLLVFFHQSREFLLSLDEEKATVALITVNNQFAAIVDSLKASDRSVRSAQDSIGPLVQVAGSLGLSKATKRDKLLSITTGTAIVAAQFSASSAKSVYLSARDGVNSLLVQGDNLLNADPTLNKTKAAASYAKLKDSYVNFAKALDADYNALAGNLNLVKLAIADL